MRYNYVIQILTDPKRGGIFNLRKEKMEGLDLKQLGEMVKVIADEKGLPEETVLDVVQMAIAAAWRRENGDREMEVRALLDTHTGKAKVFVAKQVIEDGLAYNTATEIPLEEAKKLDKDAELEGTVEESYEVTEFGRVGAVAAKQVVLQRLREAERDAVLSAFEDKIGTVVTGVVSRVEPRLIRVDLGRANGIMPRSEQIDGEHWNVGERIKVYIKGVEHDDAKAQLILSRGNTEFIEYLFRQEVPELDNGSVEIRGIAREAGRRTKIAVMSTVPGVDPVGTFVGGRGVRVQAITGEIGDREKIDIINWSENPSEYIREALSPAEVMKVEIDGKNAKVYVTEDQQSIAIGRQGQNVRLASKLTGFDIDIELAKAPEKKKRKNAEDSLLSAISESTDDEDVSSATATEEADAEAVAAGSSLEEPSSELGKETEVNSDEEMGGENE
jgi:N utilization substance protein A